MEALSVGTFPGVIYLVKQLMSYAAFSLRVG